MFTVITPRICSNSTVSNAGVRLIESKPFLIKFTSVMVLNVLLFVMPSRFAYQGFFACDVVAAAAVAAVDDDEAADEDASEDDDFAATVGDLCEENKSQTTCRIQQFQSFE